MSPSVPEDIYQTGLEQFANENYAAAELSFKDIIDNHSETPFAKAAMHELYALTQSTDGNFAGLRNYYEAFTATDSALFDLAEFLATRCNVAIKNWQPAVDWYENRIDNPPSYQDSVFAVIDLGKIHIMIVEEETEDDGANFSRDPDSQRQIIYRILAAKPESRQVYEVNKTNLLATLPKFSKTQSPIVEDSGVHSSKVSIYPNPTSGNLQVTSNELPVTSVEIFDILGQSIKSKIVSRQSKIDFDISDLPDGIYVVKVRLSNGEVVVQRLVKQ
jgi:tetratricopeptide (TPR) repeat protein